MSWRSIGGRVDRLERGRPTADPNKPPPYFWDVLCGAVNPDDLPAADSARIKGWWDARCEESRRERIATVQRLVDLMRTECGAAGQGVPTAEELVDREQREPGFFVIEELLRLLESSPPVTNCPTLPLGSDSGRTR
jgi:hypothetical protein